MNCEQFIEQICIDPNSTEPALQEHQRDCVSCAAYAARARKAESLIHAALQLDTAHIAGRPGRPGRLTRWSSLAAAIVAGFAVRFGLGIGRSASTGELVAEVLVHWDHEPAALTRSAAAVSPDALEQVLAGEAAIDLEALSLAGAGPLTYAKKCIVAGQWMAHLVVQSGDGPVTIMLIPQHAVGAIVPLELAERGLGGSLFPSGAGAVAVFGADGAASGPVAQRIAAAVDLSI